MEIKLFSHVFFVCFYISWTQSGSSEGTKALVIDYLQFEESEILKKQVSIWITFFDWFSLWDYWKIIKVFFGSKEGLAMNLCPLWFLLWN